MNATTENNTQSTTTYDRPARPELRRSTDDRMLAVRGPGLARYLDVDATLVRIAFVVLTVVGGAGVLALPGLLAADPGGRRRPVDRRVVPRLPPQPLTRPPTRPAVPKKETTAMSAPGRPRLPLLRMILVIIVVLAVVNIVAHLFSPWLLLAAAVIAWVVFRARHTVR